MGDLEVQQSRLIFLKADLDIIRKQIYNLRRSEMQDRHYGGFGKPSWLTNIDIQKYTDKENSILQEIYSLEANIMLLEQKEKKNKKLLLLL